MQGKRIQTTIGENELGFESNTGVGLEILPRFMVPSDSELEEIKIISFESSPLFFVIHPEVQKNRKFILSSDYIMAIQRKMV